MSLRPRWRKMLSDLWDNKSRSILVILSIAIGVFSVGMIAGAYMIISNDMSASYAASHPANIQVATDPFDDDFVGSVKHIPGVKDAEGRQYVSVRVKVDGDEWASLTLIAISDFQKSNINTLTPISGAPVPQDKQILLERNALKKFSAAPGDRLEIQLPDNSLKEMTVAGIALDQTTAAGSFLAAPIGFITYNTLDWLGQPSNYNRLFVTVSDQPDNADHIRQISNLVTDKLEKSGRLVYREEIFKTHEHPMQSTVQAILGVLGALGVLIVFLSSSLIANTLNALLMQHTRFIGVMKLIGGRRGQIVSLYMAMILAFGLISLIIAIPAGGQAAYALSQLIAYEMNFELLGYRILPPAILIQVVIALVVPLAAGFIPINNGSRITVQKAISGYTGETGPSHARQADHRAPLLSIERFHWISRPLLLSLRNTFRRKGRLALTLFTLSMAGAIFIAVFNVRVSLHQYVNNIGNYFLADVSLNFDRPYRIHQIQLEAKQVPGVQAVEGWAYSEAEILNPDKTVAKNIQVLAPPADSHMVSPMLLSGRWIAPGDGNAIAISEAILGTFPNLKPGDHLVLKINGKEAAWTVVGIFKFVGSQELLAYASYDTLSRMVDLSGQAITYRIITEQHSQAYQKQISAQIDRYFRDRGYHVSSVEAGQSSLASASESLDVLITFLLIMALLTAAVGSIGLTGTMGMNVMERTREIGVMRSIGAVDREVIKSVMVEGALIGLISWLIGAVLSFPISFLLSSIIGLAIFETPIALIFSPLGFVIWLALVLALAALASLLPARNAARLTIREVLAYE